MNGSHGHWSKHRRWAKDWRERTHQHLWVALRAQLPSTVAVRMSADYARLPKRVAFMAHTANHWDDDGLRAGLKPVRDALKDARLIDDDSKASRHTFAYDYVIDRANRGVEITWESLTPAPA